MRGYRNVNLNIGLMTLPVTIATYASETSDPRGEVVGPNGEALRQVYVNDDGTEVSRDETKRSFDGRVLTQEELKNINAECKIEDLEIQELCPVDQIDNLRVQKSYYIYPNRKSGNPRVFKTFVEALKKTKRAAIVKWTPSSRQQLLALRVEDNMLVGTALAFAGDVKEADNDVTGFQSEKVAKKELDLAIQLLDAIGGEGDALYAAYDEAIPMKRELIEGTRQIEDKDEKAPPKDAAQDFLADLEASIEQVKS
jgi:DNA end-binding protein Ku